MEQKEGNTSPKDEDSEIEKEVDDTHIYFIIKKLAEGQTMDDESVKK